MNIQNKKYLEIVEKIELFKRVKAHLKKSSEKNIVKESFFDFFKFTVAFTATAYCLFSITKIDFTPYLFGSYLGDSLLTAFSFGFLSLAIVAYFCEISMLLEEEEVIDKKKYRITFYISFISLISLTFLEGLMLFNFITFYFILFSFVIAMIGNIIYLSIGYSDTQKVPTAEKTLNRPEDYDIKFFKDNPNVIDSLRKERDLMIENLHEDKESLIELNKIQNNRDLTDAQRNDIRFTLSKFKEKTEEKLRNKTFEDYLNVKFEEERNIELRNY